MNVQFWRLRVGLADDSFGHVFVVLLRLLNHWNSPRTVFLVLRSTFQCRNEGRACLTQQCRAERRGPAEMHFLAES